MSSITFRRTWEVEGVLTDATSAKLSDATGAYGIKRNDTAAVVVADGTNMTKVSTGVYEYTFTTPVEGVAYTAWVEIVYDGETYRFEHDFTGPAAATTMTLNFTELQQRISRYLFGSRSVTALATAETDDISAIIKDGLFSVYHAHDWSFLRPRYPITTVAGTSTYNLPAGFDSIEGPITYPTSSSTWYRPIVLVKESEIRRRQQDTTNTSRPELAALVTATFDDTVGSAKQIVLWPTPDAIYTLTAIMRLRATMIDASHPYPLGGELLAPVLIEACLAAAERSMDDNPQGVHAVQFDKLLAAAIVKDREGSCPETLGKDCGSQEGSRIGGIVHTNAGTITFNGTVI